ncbi:MAG: sigma 54-interacting transcriptional regulator, partial [Granulicella sp.]
AEDVNVPAPADHVLIGGVEMPLNNDPTPSRFTTPNPRNEEVFIAGMIGRSAPMHELARLIRLVAPRSATVLIEGETGTGKEVAAKAIHRLSARASKSFTVLNCAAIPETLLEAELFGHARGAFTGAVQSRTGRIEAADGGTLFLDEIGEMPLALQAKMLRFLENGELQRVGDNEVIHVNVRVIAATHQPLEQRAEERLFRLDLYHRLAVFPIEVPALRERMDDLPLLVSFFLEQMGHDMPQKRMASEAFKQLIGYHWPGNVRELMHVLERAAILAGDHPEIGADEIRLRRATQRSAT